MKNPFYNWLTDEEQKIVFLLLLFAFVGLAVQFTGLVADENPAVADSLQAAVEKDFEIKYDLRTATKKELITIPGIGEKRAEDILFYREEHGFQSLSDLKKVRGIGEATFNRLESYFIAFETEAATTEAITEPIKTAKPKVKSAPAVSEKININTANAEELQKIRGVGPATAQKILDLRNELGTFTSFEQLLQVRGIGPKTLEKMLPYLEL